MKTKIILIGGFLGAGKTTAINALAKKFASKKKSVGIVSNDQTNNLVDTYVFKQNFETKEVSGSCFCCNFNGFKDALNKLANDGAEIVLAEPVGSCTDLASTIIRPLKKFCPSYKIASLVVLADPKRIALELASKKPSIDADAAYIIEKQIEEADIVVLTKSDLRTKADFASAKKYLSKNFPKKTVLEISSKTGSGLDELIKQISSNRISGTAKMNLDYDRYADGEASLGWLNMRGEIKAIKDEKQNLKVFAKTLIQNFKKALGAQKANIGHAKFTVSFAGKNFTANLVSLKDSALITENKVCENENILIVNIRAELKAKKLEKLAKEILKETSTGGFKTKLIESKSLTPGRPNPTYRL